MSLALLRFLAMTFGPAITAAARPAATFFAVQITVAALVYQELAALPAVFAWLVEVPALVVAGALAALESVAQHDADVAGIARELHLDKVSGAFSAFTAALLFAALGMPEAEAAALIEGGAADGLGDEGVLGATAEAARSEHGAAVQVGAVGGAVAINAGLTWLRGQLLAFLDDFDLHALWARLETGGVLGVLILLPLMPLVIVACALVLAGAAGMAAWAARSAGARLERRRRVACGGCGYEVRREASVCPECDASRTPELEATSRMTTAWRALVSRDPAHIER